MVHRRVRACFLADQKLEFVHGSTLVIPSKVIHQIVNDDSEPMRSVAAPVGDAGQGVQTGWRIDGFAVAKRSQLALLCSRRPGESVDPMRPCPMTA